MLFNVMHASAKRKVAILQQGVSIYRNKKGLVYSMCSSPGLLKSLAADGLTKGTVFTLGFEALWFRVCYDLLF